MSLKFDRQVMRLMRSKVRRGICLVWRLLAAAAVAAAIQALSVGYVILLALKIEGAFEFVLYTDSQYAYRTPPDPFPMPRDPFPV